MHKAPSHINLEIKGVYKNILIVDIKMIGSKKKKKSALNILIYQINTRTHYII